MTKIPAILFLALTFAAPSIVQAQNTNSAQHPNPGKPERAWFKEFPDTDFKKTSIKFDTIVTDGPKRDQIPPIHNPKYIDAKDDTELGKLEPVLSVVINGDARAYPLRIMLWHEIVNDTIGGVPVLVSYCPLCNSGVVFDRRVGDKTLTFGNTGRIRHFDMVMYDQQTESWWQQFLGEAIVGDLTGHSMKLLPARLESLEKFLERAPNGKLLVPNNVRARPYGRSPYQGMERAGAFSPFAQYDLPRGVAAMDRVVIVGNEAWKVQDIRDKKRLTQGDLIFTWEPGQNSLHDHQIIAKGRDVGNVIVKKKTASGEEDFPYDLTFAFAFKAFRPDGTFHVDLTGLPKPPK